MGSDLVEVTPACSRRLGCFFGMIWDLEVFLSNGSWGWRRKAIKSFGMGGGGDEFLWISPGQNRRPCDL